MLGKKLESVVHIKVRIDGQLALKPYHTLIQQLISIKVVVQISFHQQIY